jgi:hypothetical protein
MGKNLLNGFIKGGAGKTVAPGMIRGRRFVGSDLPIQGFGIDDFGLVWGFVKGGKG